MTLAQWGRSGAWVSGCLTAPRALAPASCGFSVTSLSPLLPLLLSW